MSDPDTPIWTLIAICAGLACFAYMVLRVRAAQQQELVRDNDATSPVDPGDMLKRLRDGGAL